MQDLNEFPIEHGFSEHPATHDESSINKKRRSDRARIPRRKPITDFILVESDCKHSKDCKHWKTFSASKKNSVRAKQWRESQVSVLLLIVCFFVNNIYRNFFISQKKSYVKKVKFHLLDIDLFGLKKRRKQNMIEIIKIREKNIIHSKEKKGKKCLQNQERSIINVGCRFLMI